MKTLLEVLALATVASCWTIHNGEIVSNTATVIKLPSILHIGHYNETITKNLMSNLQEKHITKLYIVKSTPEDIEDGALCASPVTTIKILESSFNLTKEMFGSCPSLTHLNLDGYKNKDVYLGQDFLSAFPNLERLTLLNYPTVKEITMDNFRGLDKLRYLEISGTSLEKIDAQVFSHMTDLQELRLPNNKVETVEGVFANKKLNDMNLESNKLQQFPWEALKDLESLENFNIGRNPILEYDVDKIAKYAPKLHQLTYSDHSGIGLCETMIKLEEKFGDDIWIHCLQE